MAGGLKFTVSLLQGEFDRALQGVYEPIAQAATDACREAADLGKTQARASIAAAGFSRQWQNALRADVFPKSPKASASAAVQFYHSIPYAGVFETGAVIRGKPKLYVPLPSAPKRVARRRLTPERFVQNIGPLFPMKLKGKTYLAARLGLSKPAAKRGPPYKMTMAELRRGARFEGVVRTVPIFVGVDLVNIRKRFDVQSAFNAAADALPRLYDKNMRG